MSNSLNRKLSLVCLVAGFISIFASIGIWFFYQASEAAHAERFGIFVGLWAPTFMGLACFLRLRSGELAKTVKAN
jgi:hypothetical protein